MGWGGMIHITAIDIKNGHKSILMTPNTLRTNPHSEQIAAVEDSGAADGQKLKMS